MSITSGFISSTGALQQVDPTHGEPTTQGYTTAATAAASGRVAAPTIGATVATIASGSLPAGTYEVSVLAGVGGTVAALDFGNMRLKKAAADVVDVAAPTNATETLTRIPRVVLDGSSALTVYAVVGATAGSVYHAVIIATPLA